MNALQICPWQFSHVLWLRRYKRKYIENWRFHTNAVTLIPNFRYKGSPPPIIFARLVQWMPYNFATDSFHTKKLCSRLSSSKVHFLMKIGRFAFLRPPLGDLGATYDDHLRLIGKRVLDFLLALIELFSLRAIIGWKSAISFQRGSVDPKFHVEGVAPTNHSSSQKTRLNVLSYGI